MKRLLVTAVIVLFAGMAYAGETKTLSGKKDTEIPANSGKSWQKPQAASSNSGTGLTDAEIAQRIRNSVNERKNMSEADKALAAKIRNGVNENKVNYRPGNNAVPKEVYEDGSAVVKQPDPILDYDIE
jgi:hypothetical protein